MFIEEAVVFCTITHAVSVGVALSRVGGIVALGREFRVPELVKIGPQSLQIHVAGLVEVKTVSVVVVECIPRVRGVQAVDDLPSIGHAVRVRIVGARVHELQIRKLTG